MTALGRAKLGNSPNLGWRDDVSGEIGGTSNGWNGDAESSGSRPRGNRTLSDGCLRAKFIIIEHIEMMVDI